MTKTPRTRQRWDFGFTLRQHPYPYMVYGPVLLGFLIAVGSYSHLLAIGPGNRRLYFHYLPLALCVLGGGVLQVVLSVVCPASKRIDIDATVKSLDEWRKVDIRNKANTLIAAIGIASICLLMGWVLGGWVMAVFVVR